MVEQRTKISAPSRRDVQLVAPSVPILAPMTSCETLGRETIGNLIAHAASISYSVGTGRYEHEELGFLIYCLLRTMEYTRT